MLIRGHLMIRLREALNCSQNLLNTSPQFLLHLKIPKAQHGPAFGLVVGIDFPVTLSISFDLGNPKVAVGFDGILAVFPVMPMPEGTIHKNHQFVGQGNGIFFRVKFENLIKKTSWLSF
jgi:hypothetical protein